MSGTGAVAAAGAVQQGALLQATGAAQAGAFFGPLPHGEFGAVRLQRRVTYTVGKLAGEWSVLVDGGYVDYLGMGEVVTVYVHPGWHTLAIQPPRGATPAELRFAAAAGEVLGFGCWLPGGVQWRPQVLLQQEPPIRVVGRPSEEPTQQ